MLEHLQTTGTQFEPVTIQTSAEAEPTQLIPDDQFQAEVRIRHPDLISALPVTEMKPIDRETRLLIAQELAE
ncbi:unnamed protein product, partial [Echinostoma caproni]